VKRIDHPESRHLDEVGIVGPEFRGAIVNRGERDLKIEDTRAGDIEVGGEPDEPRGEPRPGCPELRARRHQGIEKRAGFSGRRRSARRRRVRDHRQEFHHAGIGQPPAPPALSRPLDGPLRCLVLRGGSPMRVDEQIRIQRHPRTPATRHAQCAKCPSPEVHETLLDGTRYNQRGVPILCP